MTQEIPPTFKSQSDVQIETPSRNFFRIGKWISIALLVLVLIYGLIEHDQFWRMTANEFGDFLAGVFGPLALLWVVLGFLQQGQELGYSRQALLMQARELRDSVKAQQDLVDAAKDQLAIETDRLKDEREQREILKKQADDSLAPRLRIDPTYDLFPDETKKDTFRFRIFNIGATCQDIVVSLMGDSGPPVARINELLAKNEKAFHVRTKSDVGPVTIVLLVTARSGHGKKYARRYDIVIEDGEHRLVDGLGTPIDDSP